jgi:hypothetical protein
MRVVAAIIAGLVAGLLATILAGFIGVGATFTPPADLNPSDTRLMLQAFSQGTFVALGLAWALGGLVGAAVARLISRGAVAAWLVALLFTAAFGLGSLSLDVPTWVKALWIAGPLVGGLIANLLIRVSAASADGEAVAEAPAYDPADD